MPRVKMAAPLKLKGEMARILEARIREQLTRSESAMLSKVEMDDIINRFDRRGDLSKGDVTKLLRLNKRLRS